MLPTRQPPVCTLCMVFQIIWAQRPVDIMWQLVSTLQRKNGMNLMIIRKYQLFLLVFTLLTVSVQKKETTLAAIRKSAIGVSSDLVPYPQETPSALVAHV
jgi:hypothetical protein